MDPVPELPLKVTAAPVGELCPVIQLDRFHNQTQIMPDGTQVKLYRDS